MSKWKQDWKTSFEEFKEGSQTTVTGTNNVLELDEIASDVSSMSNDITKAIDAAGELDDITSVMDDNMTPTAVAISTIAIESIYNRLGIAKPLNISLEETKGVVSRIWDAIKKAVKTLFEKITGFFKWMFGINKKQEAEAKQMIESVKALPAQPPKPSEPAKPVDQNPDFIDQLHMKAKSNWINQLSHKGKLEPEDILQGLKNYFRVLTSFIKTSDLFKSSLKPKTILDSKEEFDVKQFTKDIFDGIIQHDVITELPGGYYFKNTSSGEKAQSDDLKDHYEFGKNSEFKIKVDDSISCPSKQQLLAITNVNPLCIQQREKAQGIESVLKELQSSLDAAVNNPMFDGGKAAQKALKNLMYFTESLAKLTKMHVSIHEALKNYVEISKKPYVI